MPWIFAYGTLRQREVQIAVFGREVEMPDDVLPGFRLGLVAISNPGVVALSGSASHPGLVPSEEPGARVAGSALAVSDAELAAADAYESADYVRTPVVLESGRKAFAYVGKGPAAGSVLVGTAGWTIARQEAEHFPAEGSSLERYAARFPVAEINSSFHRPHRLSTWERWRDSVPEHFRFSAKIPKTITHQRKLVDCSELLTEFIGQVDVLRSKLAVLLVQLPPKLAFDAAVARQFFSDLRPLTKAHVACEPRHPSWFTEEADEILESLRVARVAADPAICPEASSPGGWHGLHYWRLHGSPIIYRSSYAERIPALAAGMTAGPEAERWCIFDNTASSAAVGDALALMEALEG